MQDKELVLYAIKALKNSYAPYSNFPVGAALLTKSGNVFTGVNIENASYGLTVCAERVAMFKAVSEGELAFERIAIAVKGKGKALPCGACLQVMAEFNPKIEILLAGGNGRFVKRKLFELMPEPFILQ